MQPVGFLNVSRPVIEKNDCTVRALANATGMGYHEAFKLAEALGRRQGSGLKWKPLCELYAPYSTLNRVITTVGAFAAQHPIGTFILHVRKHVFCLKDGVMLDTGASKPTARVDYAWTVHMTNLIAKPMPAKMSLAEILAKAKSARVAPALSVDT